MMSFAARSCSITAVIASGVTALMASTAALASDKSIALIVDASGNMRSKLASGQRRIEAAQIAVSKLVSGLPSTTRLALRAYGHQSVTAKKIAWTPSC